MVEISFAADNVHKFIYMAVQTPSWGYEVAQLVDALCYKPEGHGCHCNFSLTYSFWPQYSPGVESAWGLKAVGA